MHRLILLAASVLALGCPAEPTEPPPFVPGDPNLTADTGLGELAGGISISPVLDFEGRFGLASDQTQPCSYDTTKGFGITECRLDANELDLYFHGWGYNLRIQPNTCTYVRYDNYIYQAWEIGAGPTEVPEDSPAECQFNYSQFIIGAPNCCTGTYYRINGAGARTEGPFAWGGELNIGACYGGAAFVSNITAFLPNGVPASIIRDVDEDAATTDTITFDGPIDSLKFSNIQSANYLDPKDPIPLGYQGVYSQPNYQISCLDDAEEVLAMFRIQVRDWDTVAEFSNVETGNPDSGAGNPGPLEANGKSPINDRWDWRDFEVFFQLDYPTFFE